MRKRSAKHLFEEAVIDIATQTDDWAEITNNPCCAVWDFEVGDEQLVLKLQRLELGGTVFLRLTCGFDEYDMSRGWWDYYHADAISRYNDPRTRSAALYRYTVYETMRDVVRVVADDVRRCFSAQELAGDLLPGAPASVG